MCLYPKLVENPKYKANKKNGWNPPAISDIRVKYVPIGCGRCMECMSKKKREWQIRLTEEIETSENGIFITLTFSNESIKKIICENETLQKLEGYELDNEIATRAVRLWLERWRKKYGKSLRHWLVTELGHNGTENIHLHGIIWTNTPEAVETTWQYGYIWPNKKTTLKNYVNVKTVNYIIKYINKVDLNHKYYKPIILTSPGIGANYTKTARFTRHKYNGTTTKETYKTRSGHEVSIPIYYRNKAYTDEEKEKLWLNTLDKNERYVGGEKIKADDLTTYNKLLEFYRKKNQELGYGSDEIDWNREQYELQQRIINYETRLKKIKNEKK